MQPPASTSAPSAISSASISTRFLNFYYLTVFLVVLCILVTWLVSVSRYGRTLRALRENEVLARSIGIHTGFHKVAAFMLSGLFAGLAGVLQAYFLQHISPTLYDTFPSVYLALMVMLGGPRMLYGPLAGAIIVNFLPEVMHLDPVDFAHRLRRGARGRHHAAARAA